MDERHSETHYDQHEEPKEQQRLIKPSWSSISNLYDIPEVPYSPSASEIEINLAIDSSLGSEDSTISGSSIGLSDPLYAQFANLSLSSSTPEMFGLCSIGDPLPLIHSSVPLRIGSRGDRHRPLPFPLQAGPPLARNAIVRSYAMVQAQPDRVRMFANPGKSMLANRSLKRPGSVRSKAKPYSKDDPMRQWKPHVRFKREIANKREAKARMHRAGTLSYFAPHHQHPLGNAACLGSQIIDRSNELEIMFKKIRLVDDEHRASQSPLVIPPLINSLQVRSGAPSPASVVVTVDEDIHLPHITSRNTDMDSVSDGEGMLVDNSPLRDLWTELFGDDDPKYD